MTNNPWLQSALVALLVAAAPPLERLFGVPQDLAVSIWLPSGIGAAAIIVLGRRIWPGIAAGSLWLAFTSLEAQAAPTLTGQVTDAMIGAAIATFMTAESLVIAWLYGRLRRGADLLSSVWNVAVLLVVAAPAACLSSALAAALTLLTAGRIQWQDLAGLWSSWAISGLAGIHLITPAVLVWTAERRFALARRDVPVAILAVSGLALVSGLTFYNLMPMRPHAFLTIPLIVLVAYRFDDRLASLVGPAIALIAVVATVGGRGPFGDFSNHQSLLTLQLFLVVAILTALFARALNNERQAADVRARRLGTELSHISRVTMMGEIAAGMAHEYHQPLAAIANYAGAALIRLRRHPTVREEVGPLLERVVDEALRAAATVNRLKEFLQKREPLRVQCDVEALVADALQLTHMGHFFPGVVLTSECEAGLPRVEVDDVQVKQILVNLLVNACEAIEASGAAAGSVHVVAQAAGSNRVSILVEDDGPGMDEETAKRCFDPFYSTKRGGLGVGLGISRTLAAAHGGRLYECGGAGRGARFCLELPIRAETPLPWREPAGPSAA